ncbi:hypothetical protein [Moorena sp. SIO3A2]|uniref:hypothetical protein n=1 Tax=Moorena sp. SIO3A2 TaxID=2607841 RepID=UPI0013BDF9EC|nr:hypothetical protein [Moorena sp. SIO3A2]NER89485.1 hypothetical protein [Moorena sp. SIO3A2]
MAVTKTRNRKQPATTDATSPFKRGALDLGELNSPRVAPDVTSRLGQTLDEFYGSLGDVLIDITALEVNTMVVEEIKGDKFIPWETYRDIYPISADYLEQQGIHQSLRDRYLELRKTLELEYTVLLSDPDSPLYDPTVLEQARGGQEILTDPTLELHQINTRLPNPTKTSSSEEMLQAQQILKNNRFLRCLRKLSELKAALDSRNQALLKTNSQQRANVKSINDLICAQTVIQLDGDVINRYAQEIVNHPDRDLILHIHKQGVTASQQQWRGLLEFILGLVQGSVRWGNGDGLPWRN